MPIQYQHKRSTAVGVEPTTLQDGEIAINTAATDPKLFFKDSANTIRAFSLASYASATHTHVVADVTDLTTKANVVSVNGITGVVSLSHTSVSAAAASHTHDAADVVSGTFEIARIPTHTHTISQVSGLQSELDGKASVSATNVSRVVSLNGLTGTLTIAAGDNVTVSTAGSTITVAASAAGASGEQPYGQILLFG